jgi:hypothetical protein
MHVHSDYEPEDILAVFDRPDRARQAVRSLQSLVPDSRSVVAVPLEPGRYPLSDRRLAEEARGALRGAGFGTPLGIVAGLGAAAALPGVGPFVALAYALAGAVGGLIVGGLTGAIARTRWDRDAAEVIEVPEDAEYVLVIVHGSAAPGPRSARRLMLALERAGALGFLDPAAYYASHPTVASAVA